MTKVEAERPRLFWTHSCLEDRGFRWWSYLRGRDFFNFSIYVFTGSPGVSVQIEHGKWTAHLGLWFVSLYVSWPGKYRNYGEDREINVYFYRGTLYWRFWTDTMSWSSTTPKWRHGSFDFVNFVLGREACEHHVLEARDVTVPMPERAYAASAKLEQWTWKRPRWFAKTIKRVSIEIPGGIPFPGKGDNSWDCGDDATFSITTGTCNSIAEGVGVLVGSVLRDRIRHGGWNCWTWGRERDIPARP